MSLTHVVDERRLSVPQNHVREQERSNFSQRGTPSFVVYIEGHLSQTFVVLSYSVWQEGSYVIFDADRGVDLGQVVSCNTYSSCNFDTPHNQPNMSKDTLALLISSQ
uniref:Uncharacterized protein n=1 Tax=Lygus hesperus TaxID=30085 RepID=A0A146M0I1_LYGHE